MADKKPAKRGRKPVARKAKAPASKKPVPKPAPATVLSDLRPAPAPVLKDLPWTYGDTRIVAMAQDPRYGFVYWEYPDSALEAARAKVKDAQAAVCLRVYDSTGLDFNGLNAHRHWDIPVDRRATSHYLDLSSPGATFHVDVGVRSGSGAFFPIARSNFLEMPRDSVSPDARAEWSTVLRSGSASGYRHRHVPPPAAPPSVPPPPQPPDSGGPPDLEAILRTFTGEGWSRTEWLETTMEGRSVRWIRWTGPVPVDFPLDLPEAFRSVEILFSGERRVVKLPDGERTVYGPWRVVIEALTPGGERRIIERWMVRHRWTTEEGQVSVQTSAVLRRVLGGETVTIVRGGSEERLARELWGSEVLQLGGSEWRWTGSSELLYGGASEYRARGASEGMMLGGSERLLWGSSGEGLSR
jgi:hypothetical protein